MAVCAWIEQLACATPQGAQDILPLKIKWHERVFEPKSQKSK